MTPRYFSPPPPRPLFGRKVLFYCSLALMFAGFAAGGVLRVSVVAERADVAAKTQQEYKREILAHRGDIVDAGGAALAMSADVYEVRADMHELNKEGRRERLQHQIPALAKILRLPEETLQQKFSGSGRAVLLRRKLPPAAAEELLQLYYDRDLYGLKIERRHRRFYPQREYAASVVGWTNARGDGAAHLELASHGTLQQQNGEQRGVRSRRGKLIDRVRQSPPQNGKNITLAMDSRLQFYAYDELQKAAVRHGARAGAAAVMDVQTGEIVALASYPGFNPNNIPDRRDEKNHSLSDAVEPGSLAKPFIVALAMEEGKVKPNEIFPADKPVKVGGVLLNDKHIREPVDLAGVLQKSSNIGAAMLAMRIGRRPVWELYRDLGFGGGRVLRMPGEASGILREHDQWRASDFVTHSYGYGFSATLLQMLAGYSVFAADGLRITPRLEKSDLPPFRERILKPATARKVRAFLEGVTRPEGTAPQAAIEGYRVAGKTGTAVKPDADGGYSDDNLYRAFFVGMAPASRPRYVAAVMIDEPTRNGYGGGAAAAPVFREIMRRALRLNAVLPDAPLPEQFSTFQSATVDDQDGNGAV